MTQIYNLSFAIILLFFLSCESKEMQNKKDQSVYKSILIHSFSQISHTNSIISKEPEVFLFCFSECIGNENDFEKIISKKQIGDTLLLKIGSIQNCYGKFRLDIDINEDVLNLEIKILEQIVQRKNGMIDTIINSHDCNCYFTFDIGIKNVNNEINSILINGEKLGKKIKTTNLVIDNQSLSIFSSVNEKILKDQFYIVDSQIGNDLCF